MKILHVTATHLKPEGGVPVVLKNLVLEQNKIKNFEAMVISLVAPVKEMGSKYFEYVPIKEFNKYIVNYNPDYVILHSFYYLEYNKVVKILNQKKIKYFIEPHGSFGKAAMKKSKLKKIIANSTIFKKQIKNSFGIIFLNESEKKDSVYRTDHDIIIPNGINIDSSFRKSVCDRKNKLYFIGRYDIKHKGLDYLFNAFDILEQQHFKVEIEFWGNGDYKSCHYLNSRIKKMKYVKVNINNSIFGKNKDFHLEQLGIMLLTSRYEGFPMTILEAWFYGNPSIVTYGTNVSSEIVNNNLGWFTEFDPYSIADTIKKATKEYKKNRSKYIINCKKYVKNNYSWEKIAKLSYKELKKWM